MAKISTFLYGMIIASLVATCFTMFLGGLATHYGIAYDNSSIEAYNKLEAMSGQAEVIKSNTSDISMSSGYKVLKLMASSINVFNDMSDAAIDNSQLGAWGDFLKIAIGALIIIFIFVAIILSAILNQDR